MIAINQPFDAFDPEFIKAVRHPETLPTEVLFYSQIGAFAISGSQAEKPPEDDRVKSMQFGGLTALSIAIGGRNPLVDYEGYVQTAKLGCYLADKIGIAQPKKDYPFYHNLSDLDVEKVKWGAKFYKAVVDTDMHVQIWSTHRALSIKEMLTDAGFVAKYDHRLAHPEGSDCQNEFDNARFHAIRARFDHKLTQLTVNELRAAYWDRDREVPNINEAFNSTWTRLLVELREENEKVAEEEKAFAEEIGKDNLDYQMKKIYDELGGLRGKIFI